MASFDRTIEVKAHISDAFHVFSDFESFPTFMEGVEEVRRTGDDQLHWRAEIMGREVEWDAVITELSPSDRVSWKSTSGARNEGLVTFDKIDEQHTRVHLHVEYDPEGFIENVGAALGVVNGRMKGDLERYKEIVEEGRATHEGWHDRTDSDPDDLHHMSAIGSKPKGGLPGGGAVREDTSRRVPDRDATGTTAGTATDATTDTATGARVVPSGTPTRREDAASTPSVGTTDPRRRN